MDFFLLGRTVVVNFLTFYCFYCCVFTLAKHVQELWGFIGVSLSLLLGLSNVDCPCGTHECEFAGTQFPLNKQWLPIINLLTDICCICDEEELFKMEWNSYWGKTAPSLNKNSCAFLFITTHTPILVTDIVFFMIDKVSILSHVGTLYI